MQVPEILSLGAGIGVLVAAAVLLVLVVSVERLAEGSAIADSVAYVVAASLCLAVSVLLSWVGRFVDASSGADLLELASDLIVALAVVLFVVYFVRVRNSLKHYLSGAEEILAKMQAAEEDEDG